MCTVARLQSVYRSRGAADASVIEPQRIERLIGFALNPSSSSHDAGSHAQHASPCRDNRCSTADATVSCRRTPSRSKGFVRKVQAQISSLSWPTRLHGVLAFADPLAHAPERLCAMWVLKPMDVPSRLFCGSIAGTADQTNSSELSPAEDTGNP